MSPKTLLRSTALLFMLISMRTIAQPYSTGLGFRLGGISSGITVKHFVSSDAAIEGIASFGGHSFLLTGLYEKHNGFPNAEGLSWFYGGGIHLGFINGNYTYYDFYYRHHKHGDKVYEEFHDGSVSFGGDFIIGMEYKFNNTPITLGLDVKPFVDIVPGLYGYWEGGLSFRFTL